MLSSHQGYSFCHCYITAAAVSEVTTDTRLYSCSFFSCPRERCLKTYQRFSSSQHHLELGKHERALEHKILLDRAVLGYAAKPSGGVSQIHELRKLLILSNLPCLPMGWAPEVQSRLKNTIYRKAERLFLQQIPYC